MTELILELIKDLKAAQTRLFEHEQTLCGIIFDNEKREILEKIRCKMQKLCIELEKRIKEVCDELHRQLP